MGVGSNPTPDTVRVVTNLENSGNCRICGIIADENVFQRIISPELLREKFENDLEISGKTQGI